MSSFEQRIKASNRRGSSIGVQSNPLDQGTVAEGSSLKVENLSESRQITEQDIADILKKLKSFSTNEEILNALEIEKAPFIFSSNSLTQLLEITTSVKTRIAIILMIAPRLSDPRAKPDYFVGLFRFAEEKAQVEEAFKSRVQAINGSLFKRGESVNSLASPGRGGRGRGLGLTPGRSVSGGRGPSVHRGSASNIESEKTEEDMSSKARVMSLPVNLAARDLALSTLAPDFLNGVTSSAVEGIPRHGRDSDDDSEPEEPMQVFRPFAAAIEAEENEVDSSLCEELGVKCTVESSERTSDL